MKPRYLLLSLVLIVGGCASAPRPFESPVSPPTAWSQPGDAPLADRWWDDFDDETLNQLINRGLADSFTLRSTWDRLRQAHATAQREGAGLLPTLDGTGEIARTRGTSNGTTSGQQYQTELGLGLSASYGIDLWGRIRSTRNAAALDAAAAAEDVQAAAITLSADLAEVWFTYVEQQLQIELIGQQVATNEQLLDIIEAQFRVGQSQAEDVLRQQNLVEASRSELVVARRQARVSGLQLNVLLGATPDTPRPAVPSQLIDLPDLPSLGLPASVVQRRPDVRSAYRDVQAADRRVAAALADRYPKLSLSATAGTSGQRVGDLFNDWAGNLAGNLIQPLFDGGERAAEIDRTQAVTSEQLNIYGQVVIEALAEVETALAREQSQREFLNSLDRQSETAAAVVQSVRLSYLSGQTEYIDVLTALTSQQSLERQQLTARRELIGYRIDLCRAIAGGWVLTEPAPAELITHGDTPQLPESVYYDSNQPESSFAPLQPAP